MNENKNTIYQNLRDAPKAVLTAMLTKKIKTKHQLPKSGVKEGKSFLPYRNLKRKLKLYMYYSYILHINY